MKKLQYLTVSVCVSALSACASLNTIDNDPVYSSYQPYTYNEMQYLPPNYTVDIAEYNNGGDSNEMRGSTATVPDSYHVGAYHSPTSAKDRDREWVSSQNPQEYTIEIADDEKAANVAGKLYKAPKTNRMAEIKYNRNGKAYYKGLYGTYKSQEEAQQALNALPEDVKQGAGIKNWNNVQSNVNH